MFVQYQYVKIIIYIFGDGDPTWSLPWQHILCESAKFGCDSATTHCELCSFLFIYIPLLLNYIINKTINSSTF